MKRALAICYLWVFPLLSFAQETEFPTFSNGLIYSENTISKLRHIADSLNLRHKTCEANPVFYAKSQGLAVVVILEGELAKKAGNDLKNNITPQEFMAKYPGATVKYDTYFIKTAYTDYKGNLITRFSEFNLSPEDGRNFDFEMEDPGNDLKEKWIYEFTKKDKYTKEDRLAALYFPASFQTPALPAKYARMIGYADCLIDTTTQKKRKMPIMTG